MNLEYKKNISENFNKFSLLKKNWVKKEINSRLALAISQKYSLSNIISSLLSTRSIDIDKIKNFLKPNIEDFFPDPLIFNDMDKAAERLIKVIKNKEKVAILGDYDVDGLTSIVLLKKYLKLFGVDVFSYIPDRIKEGYGPNKNAIDKIKSKDPNLLIMLDCGTNSHEIISYIRNYKIDLIIIDHHKSNEKHLNEVILINPNTIYDTSGYNFLCSVGLLFVVLHYVQTLLKKDNVYKKDLPEVKSFLDLVALGTVCDVVPLIDLNRAFVYQGLKIFAKRSNIGLKILSDDSQLNKKPNEEDLGFFFGPRINSGGRVGKPDIGEDLLLSNDEDKLSIIVKQLNTLNYQRKLIEDKVYEESLKKIFEEKKFNQNSIFIYKDNWHEGVIGIVASRLKDKFNKPSIILTSNKDIYKGSGRSITGIDIGLLVLKAKKENIIINGGGHQMASGLSIKKENLNLFADFFENYVKEQKTKLKKNDNLYYDEAISINGINDELIEAIDAISPYGVSNSKPKFLISNVRIIKPKCVGETKKHLSFLVKDSTNKTIKAIIFNGLDNDLGKTILSNYKKNLFSFITFVKQSNWKNKIYFELIIEDGVLEKVII